MIFSLQLLPCCCCNSAHLGCESDTYNVQDKFLLLLSQTTLNIVLFSREYVKSNLYHYGNSDTNTTSGCKSKT